MGRTWDCIARGADHRQFLADRYPNQHKRVARQRGWDQSGPSRALPGMLRAAGSPAFQARSKRDAVLQPGGWRRDFVVTSRAVGRGRLVVASPA
jgi:hypothetical protein